MKTLAKRFAEGLLVVAPIVITFAVLWFVVTTLDGWLYLPIPGVGLLLSLVVITLVGFIAHSVVGNRLVDFVEKALGNLPVASLLYNPLRDLFRALVGEGKSFDKPAMVEITSDGVSDGVKVFGFVTCEQFDDPQLAGYVAVYLPQSYNFAGNLIIVPRARVHPLDADAAEFMAFIVSGGVAEMHAAKTLYESPLKK